MVDFGFDVPTHPDLDVTGRVITGAQLMAEMSLRRLTTDEGTLIYDPSFGYNLKNLLNADLDDVDLRRHELRAENQLELDERVKAASVTLDLNREKQTLKVRIGGTLVDDRTFDHVLAITALSAEILKAG